jgi:predicted nuclease of predicted toxin-antitoxin system
VSVIVLRLVNLRVDRVMSLLRRVLVAAAVELSRGAVVLVEESRFRIRRLPLVLDWREIAARARQ